MAPPGCSWMLWLPHCSLESILCFVEDHSQQVLPAYRDPEQMRRDACVEQLPAQGEDVTLGATAQAQHMLRHIKLQFHQRKLRNTRMIGYPPFPFAEWTHLYLSIYFNGKIMPNYTSQFQVCFPETKYALISKIPPLTHHHFLSELLTPSK